MNFPEMRKISILDFFCLLILGAWILLRQFVYIKLPNSTPQHAGFSFFFYGKLSNTGLNMLGVFFGALKVLFGC